MEQETWTPVERDLMAELCRYHAQTLLAKRNAFDTSGALPQVDLPRDGLVPKGTILLDGLNSAFEMAAAALLICGFATKREKGLSPNACQLLRSSDRFEVLEDFRLPYSNMSHMGSAFAAMFRTYEFDGTLGHPSSLARIFDLCRETGLIVERYGYEEWSEPAVAWATTRGRPSSSLQRNDIWSVDTLGSYVEEASAQWDASP